MEFLNKMKLASLVWARWGEHRTNSWEETRIVGWNRTASVSQELKKSGMVVADTVEDLVKKLTNKHRVMACFLQEK